MQRAPRRYRHCGRCGKRARRGLYIDGQPPRDAARCGACIRAAAADVKVEEQRPAQLQLRRAELRRQGVRQRELETEVEQVACAHLQVRSE